MKISNVIKIARNLWKQKIFRTLLGVIFLFGCPSQQNGPPPTGPEIFGSSVQCPTKKVCNIHNYDQYIYSPGVQCDLSCVKVSEVNTTNWAWDNIPPEYSSGCDALRFAQLSKAFLVCADLVGLNLSGLDLTDTNLSNANLAFANLKGAILIGTNMKEANVAGANLETDLTKTDLIGAIYDKKTTFLKGFSPESKGMLKDRF